MFDNERFLKDLLKYCKNRNINFVDLSYTEQLACIRSMLVCIAHKHKI